MFYDCLALSELNLTNFFTDNVTDMSGMFVGCISLQELNLSNFNTNNVKDMSFMFWRCWFLTKLNISNFKTNNDTCMRHMFSECSELKEIIFSKVNFKINKIDFKEMFHGCKKEFIDKIKDNLNISEINFLN